MSLYEEDVKSKRSGTSADSDGEEEEEDVELAIKSSDLIVSYIYNCHSPYSSDLKVI